MAIDTIKQYPDFNYAPYLNDKQLLDSIARDLQKISQLRGEDVKQNDDFDATFLTARKVAKVPSASNDIVVGIDRENDFNWDGSFLYFTINVAGTLVWRRITANSF